MSVLDNLLFNLQTIARIPRGRRINTAKEFITIEEDGWMQGVWRRVNADSRDKAVTSICRDVRTVIAIAGYIMESQYLVRPVGSEANTRLCDLKKIKSGLAGALAGIDNICMTYELDADVSGHLAPLSVEITACVDSIRVVALNAT